MIALEINCTDQRNRSEFTKRWLNSRRAIFCPAAFRDLVCSKWAFIQTNQILSYFQGCNELSGKFFSRLYVKFSINVGLLEFQLPPSVSKFVSQQMSNVLSTKFYFPLPQKPFSYSLGSYIALLAFKYVFHNFWYSIPFFLFISNFQKYFAIFKWSWFILNNYFDGLFCKTNFFWNVANRKIILLVKQQN
jgi:hypothetical protein